MSSEVISKGRGKILSPRAMAALRKAQHYVCAWCGKTFMALATKKAGTRRFCSNRCKQAEKNAKAKQEK